MSLSTKCRACVAWDINPISGKRTDPQTKEPCDICGGSGVLKFDPISEIQPPAGIDDPLSLDYTKPGAISKS